MSLKNRGVIIPKLKAIFTDAVQFGQIVDNQLNDMTLNAAFVIGVEGRKHFAMVESVDGVKYIVTDALGNERLFGNIAAAMRTILKANVTNGNLQVIKHNEQKTGIDPVAALKSSYKAAVKELQSATEKAQVVASSIAAAASMGWDVADPSTVERQEYDDLARRAATLGAWATLSADRKTAITTALISAGIDPNSVVPASYTPT